MSEVRRFLVTGGAGFIGSAVVRHLIGETAHEVAVVDKLTYAGNLQSLAAVAGEGRYRFFRADVADRDRMAEIVALVAPDVVMHLAAESHVDRSIDAATAFVQSNIVGTFSLLEAVRGWWRTLPAVRRDRFRFHYVSTDEVFGSADDGDSFNAASPHRPNSPYAASKAAGDHLVRAWHVTHGLPVITSHCGNNFGPYQFPEKLIPLTILNCMEDKEIPVYGDGGNVRDWLYVEDHVRALMLIAERGEAGSVHFVGGGERLANLAVVDAICGLWDARMPGKGGASRERLVRFVADRPGHDRRYAVESGQMRAEFGWLPKETFRSGLEKTFNWYLEHRSWWEPLRRRAGSGVRLGLVT